MEYMENKVFNRKELKKEIERRSSFRLTHFTIWKYEKKGYFKPSGSMQYGKRLMPVYFERDIDAIIAIIKQLKAKGIIKVRTADVKE